MSRKRLAEYTSLAANDIHMDLLARHVYLIMADLVQRPLLLLLRR